MENAAAGSTPELINLLILTSKASIGNNLKNKFTPANLKRYKQIQVVQYSDLAEQQIKQRPHALIVMLPDEKDLQKNDLQSVFQKLSKYEIKIVYSAAEAENNNEEKDVGDGFVEFGSNQFQKMHEFLVSKFDSLIVRIKEIFELYDEDKSGSLETMEVGMVLQSLGVQMSEEEVQQCAIDIDADGSGTITFEEFSTWFLTGKEGTPEHAGNIIDNLKEKANMLGNQFIKELVKVPKIENKDLHAIKLEISTKKSDKNKMDASKTTSFSANFGIASYTDQPIKSQRKEMGLDQNNKYSHIYIQFKINQDAGDVNRVLQEFKQLKIVKGITQFYEDRNQREGNRDFLSSIGSIGSDTIFWGISNKVLHQRWQSSLEALVPTFEKLLRLPKTQPASIFQKFKAQLFLKKTIDEILIGKATILQNIMAGFKIKSDISLFRYVDEILDKLIQENEEIPPSIKKISKYILLCLKVQTDAHLEVSPPQIYEFQNNLLSWIGEYGVLLNIAPANLLPFPPHSFKHALKEFNFRDVQSMKNINNQELTLAPFKALFSKSGIIDNQIFDSQTEDKLMEGLEEFALFFMKNFRAELDMTYFFYRSLYGQFSFNLENAIKVLYCLHKMTAEEGQGVEEDANKVDDAKELEHMAEEYGQDEEENQYGDYGEEVDYGDERDLQEEDDDQEKASHSNHSKHYHEGDGQSSAEESKEEEPREDQPAEMEELNQDPVQEEEQKQEEEGQEDEESENQFDYLAQNYSIQQRRTKMRGVSEYTQEEGEYENEEEEDA